MGPNERRIEIMEVLCHRRQETMENLAAGYRLLADANIKADEVSIQDISFVLSEKINKGKATKIKALLKKYNAEKLVEIRPEDYEAIFEEAKIL